MESPTTHATLYVFGDQTNNFTSGLRQLLRNKEGPLLVSFLEKTHIALRREITGQTREIQELIPRFSCAVDLVTAYCSDHEAAPVLASTLTTIYQLDSFISYYGDGSSSYPTGDNNHLVLGLCTGQLAACAIASASTINELITLAVEVVVVAFRTGILVYKAREFLEHGQDKRGNWSYIIPKLPEQDASSRIEQFSRLKNFPVGSAPFIGSVSPTSVTIFGCPTVLKDFFSSHLMNDVRPIAASVFAPYHEPLLYSESDIHEIVASLSDSAHKTVPKMQVLSSVTGEPIDAATLGDLLRASLNEILREQLRLDRILMSVRKRPLFLASQWNIMSVGTTLCQPLADALGKITGTSVVIKQLDSTHFSDLQAKGTGRPEQSKIAIIGYSGRFPEAANPEGLWKLLHEGRDVHREIPADRFDVEAHYDASGKKKNTSQVRHGCFINEPGLFDCRFFNLSPKEADQSDPGQRMALLTAYEALEMAGVVPDRTPSTQRDRVGIFYGTTSDDWREVNSGQNVGTYFIPGGNRAFTPGRINYHFKFSGPSVSIDTACSSSAAAIHMACNSLWRNDCDTAIAGGTNVMTNPDNFTGLDKGHFLSRTGNCKPFDDGADGYCRADAVGTVVLKRLDDALADKDPIQAVICGAFTNHSAEAESITRPHIGAQATIFRRILSDSGCDPTDISYIEMHGTGTQAGDAVEMRSVLDVFTGDLSGRQADKPLYLGSVKANVGHAESASGVTSLIKVMMMMKNSEIPPHCGIKTKINSGFPLDLKDRGIRIALEPTSWPKPRDGKRRAFLNNFSAAGGNSALLIEDTPTISTTNNRDLPDPRDFHAVTISAKTVKSLRKNLECLAAHLARHPDVSLGNLAYTTCVRRLHHSYRASVTGQTIAQIESNLKQAADQDFKPVSRKMPSVIFAFTGQGSVYEGIGSVLALSFEVFRLELRRLDDIARNFGFDSFLPLVIGGDDNKEQEIRDFSPQATQLALICFEIALARLWQSFGISPSVVVGHSLGEYAALHIAGVISARDVIFLVGTRARIMQGSCSAGTHAMIAVKASLDELDETIKSHQLEIACINSTTQIVLAGSVANITAAQEALQALGLKTTKLETDFAFHSSQVEPVLEDFINQTNGVVFRKPNIPVLSPLLSSVVTENGTLGVNYLAQHCRKTVNILGAVQFTVSQGSLSSDSICLEIGPDPVVVNMLKGILGPSIRAIASVRKNDTSVWKSLTDALVTFYQAGFDLRWDEYHRDFDEYNRVITLPSYQWDYKNHWIQYVHNWCLTKGDAPLSATTKQADQIAPELPAATISLSATCQRVLKSEHSTKKSFILIESDSSQPELRSVFEAHKVNDTMLCPSSAYADIAITLASYLHEKDNPIGTNHGIEVANMNTAKPLIMQNLDSPKLFRASLEADWTTQTGNMSLYSVDGQGKKLMEHATCLVRFGNPESWSSEWRRSAYLIKSRMQSLRDGVLAGRCHHIMKSMAYKLFENCVEYSDAFRGIEEVILDSAAHEATARVVLKDNSNSFRANPYYIDSLGHISGFVMNATELFDHKVQVFINHGWESIRCSKKLSPEKHYDTYVKMQSTDGKKYIGDVYVFCGDDIICLNRGVAFQAVPRRVLDTILPGVTRSTKIAVPRKEAMSTTEHVAQPKPSLKRESVISKTPNPAQRQKDTTTKSVLIARALDIIATETGVSISDMTDDLVFECIGMDSLLSLTVCGRLREELNVNISSSLFTDCPTLRDLKNQLCGLRSESSVSAHLEDSSLSSSTSTIDSGLSSDTEGTEASSSATDVDDLTSESGYENLMSAICEVLADEIGVKLEDIWGGDSLVELGFDSLMSLAVLGRLREERDIDLPAELFSEHDNLASIRSQIIGGDAKTLTHSKPVNTPTVSVSTSKTSTTPATNIPAATSVVLQGSVCTAKKILFLFPDGSGSATSYCTLPRIGSDVAVVGLNCPYMKRPQDMKCSLQSLTAPYIAEIRRRQAQGPYYLGGWSAGGICAYDAAAVLIASGEEVKSLILIDSPNPIRLEKLPVRMYDFLETAGVFGSGDTGRPLPKWLLPHFLAFIDALAQYEPTPFSVGSAPRTHAIWASDGVYRSTGEKRLEERADDTREMKWLLEDRKVFGPNGWDLLVGQENFNMEVLHGANHFTMMSGEQGFKLSKFLANSLL